MGEGGKYGEPWSVSQGEDADDIIDSMGNYRLMNYPEASKSLDRAAVCVNALAGIRNPQAVKEVIEAARQTIEGFDGLGISLKGLKAALASLDKESEQ